jgi:hypothetical protein
LTVEIGKYPQKTEMTRPKLEMPKAKKADRTQDKGRYSTGQLFNFARDSYLERTSRPIYAIVFLLPFIIFYEVGTFQINTDVLNQSQIRVVAFVWLQNLLESVGFAGKFAWVAPPLAVVVILTALQITSRKRWRFWLGDILPMAVECVLLAVPLIVLTLFLSSSAGPQRDVVRVDNDMIQARSVSLPACSSVAGNRPPPTGRAGAVEPGRSLLANIVTGIGAGIYEELVFRLILICTLMLLFQDALRLTHRNSIILSVLISAALFSAHHHIVLLDGQLGQAAAFDWAKFGFRTVAGIYFAMLFAIRGFGITAGTHAFYDIIATIINAIFFPQ